MNIYSISPCWFWEHWHFDFGLSRPCFHSNPSPVRPCDAFKGHGIKSHMIWLRACRTSHNYFTTRKHWQWFVCLAHATNIADYLARKSHGSCVVCWVLFFFFWCSRACFLASWRLRPARWHVYVILRARDSDCEWWYNFNVSAHRVCVCAWSSRAMMIK